MHVLIIPRGLYDVPGVPNQGVFESHQAAALRSSGIQVGVLSGGVITTRHLGRSFPYARYELSNQIPVYRAYRRAYLPARWEAPLAAARRTYRRLKPQLLTYMANHGRPDIIHAHNLASGGLLARCISEEFSVPFVVTEHSGTYAKGLDAVQRDVKVLGTAAELASAIVAVGRPLAQHLRTGLGGKLAAKIIVVPNVVDPSLLAATLRARADRFVVAGLGNLIEGKNYGLLIRSFAQANLPADSRLLIGGTGPQLARLRKMSAQLGIEDRVALPGHLDRPGVVSLLQAADLFAHPSDSESFGVVLIEALAMGDPVLATASGGPEDIVTNDVGRLTPVGDVEAFAEGLSDMFRRRTEFDPHEIREACRSRFGPVAFAARMLEIYNRAVT